MRFSDRPGRLPYSSERLPDRSEWLSDGSVGFPFRRFNNGEAPDGQEASPVASPNKEKVEESSTLLAWTKTSLEDDGTEFHSFARDRAFDTPNRSPDSRRALPSTRKSLGRPGMQSGANNGFGFPLTIWYIVAVQRFVLTVLLALAAFSASASILLDEPFAYPDGSLVSVAAGQWQTHNGTSGQANVASGRLFLTGSEGEDVNALLAGQPYSSSSTTPLFARFTLHFATLPSSGGDYFAHFKDSGTSNYRGRLFAFTSGAASGRFRLGIASGSSSADVVFPEDLELNTGYVVVLRYLPYSGSTTLWINPASEASTSILSTDQSSGSNVVGFAFRQSSGIGSFYVDDLRVGTEFGELAASSPPAITTQPLSQTVTEGSDVQITAGISGSAPLHIQWHFNGTPVAGATRTLLTLSSVTESNEGSYFVTASNALGIATSDAVALTVNPFVAYQPAALSLLCYNVKGNGTTDWSTNTPQAQAIGRQLAFLQPDIVTFQEIPFTNTWQMPNWMNAFLPGYHLATNSGTDGFVRSVIASRFPITRSQKWLDGADLRPFGYTNENGNLDNFSRDLFEAQIAVPHFTQPLHVFTTHLKSGGLSNDVAKRAAEAAAISNFFVNAFLPGNANRPYVLTGDMNESDTNELSIQRLISPPTGLRLTNPQNPVSGSVNTWSTSTANPGSRLDYIMPGGLLYSNINNSQVFRTDRLTPVPPGLFASDCKTASDHLPVLMVFNNPFEGPFHASAQITNQLLSLQWQSSRGRTYDVETSSNLENWNLLAGSLVANSTNFTLVTNVSGGAKFFRINRR